MKGNDIRRSTDDDHEVRTMDGEVRTVEDGGGRRTGEDGEARAVEEELWVRRKDLKFGLTKTKLTAKTGVYKKRNEHEHLLHAFYRSPHIPIPI